MGADSTRDSEGAAAKLEVRVTVMPGGVILIEEPHCENSEDRFRVDELREWIIRHGGGTITPHLKSQLADDESAAVRCQYLALAVKAFRQKSRSRCAAAVIEFDRRQGPRSGRPTPAPE